MIIELAGDYRSWFRPLVIAGTATAAVGLAAYCWKSYHSAAEEHEKKFTVVRRSTVRSIEVDLGPGMKLAATQVHSTQRQHLVASAAHSSTLEGLAEETEEEDDDDSCGSRPALATIVSHESYAPDPFEDAPFNRPRSVRDTEGSLQGQPCDGRNLCPLCTCTMGVIANEKSLPCVEGTRYP